MECINHPGTAAAGTCQFCGKALCPDCINRFNPPLCEPCLLSHNAGVARRLYIDLAVTAVIFLGVTIAIAMSAPTNKSGATMLGLMAAGAYWGWQFLNRFSVPVLFTSGFGLTMYVLIKFTLAICTGFIVAPWQIFKRIKEINAINRLKKEIHSGTV